MKISRSKLRSIINKLINEAYDMDSDDEFDRRRDYRAMGFNPNAPGLEDIYGSYDDDYDPFDPKRPEYRDFEREDDVVLSKDEDDELPEEELPSRQLSLPFGRR